MRRSITYFHISMKISDSWLTNLFLSVWCVCVCVMFTYTTFISIICVWQEEPSLIASNQLMNNLQVNAFWKDKTLWKVNFWYHWIIHLIIYLIIWYNKGSSFEHITSGTNIHFDECVSLMAPECNVFVRLWYQIGVPVKNHIMCQTSVNLTPCCIKHTSRSFWYQGHIIIK